MKGPTVAKEVSGGSNRCESAFWGSQNNSISRDTCPNFFLLLSYVLHPFDYVLRKHVTMMQDVLADHTSSQLWFLQSIWNQLYANRCVFTTLWSQFKKRKENVKYLRPDMMCTLPRLFREIRPPFKKKTFYY